MLASSAALPQNLNAQQNTDDKDSSVPWACVSLPTGEEGAERGDPKANQNYSRSFNEFYRLWCTSAPGSPRAREKAANSLTKRWKQLWYSKDAYNVVFHEMGSFELLVVIAITREVPKPLIDDPRFMHHWLVDCKESCFQIFGNDDPGVKAESLKLLRLRADVTDQLQGDPAAKPVLEMLKNARLDDLVN